MSMLKCDPRAFARCPYNKTCVSVEKAEFMELLKKGGNTVEKDRVGKALAEMVEAIMEKYPGAVEANIRIYQGKAEINVAQVDYRKVEKC